MNKAIEINSPQDGGIQLNTKLKNGNIWLTQSQMAELFGKDITTITGHISDIFKEGELDESLVCAKNVYTKDYDRRSGFAQVEDVTYYNLDVIISVGYRVKSPQGTRFRQWASSILKQYLIKDYAINQQIKLDRYNELKEVVYLMSRTASSQKKDLYSKFEGNRVYNKLGELVGENAPLQFNIMLDAVDVTKDGISFSKEFIEKAKKFYEAKVVNKDFNSDDINGIDTSENAKRLLDFLSTELSVDEENEDRLETLVKIMQEVYYNTHSDVNSTTTINTENDKALNFGYTNTYEREQGKQHSANQLVKLVNDLQNRGAELPKNMYEYLSSGLFSFWVNKLYNHASAKTGLSVNSIRQEWSRLIYIQINKNSTDRTDALNYLKSLLGDDISITEQNIFAIVKELVTSPETRQDYMYEILANRNCKNVYGLIDTETSEDDKVTESVEDATEEETKVDSDMFYNDISSSEGMNRYDHSGQFTSYMSHLGDRLFNYFVTLPKYTQPVLGSEDTNNTYGVAETMDAVSCTSVLYNQGNFKNVADMIESIERIGKRIKGFECFVKFADDLRRNSDFATEVFTTFAKIKVDRIELDFNGTEAFTVQSNKSADVSNVILSSIYSDISAYVASNDTYKIDEAINAVNNVIYSNNSNNITREMFYKLKLKAFSLLFPSLDINTIESCLNDNKVNITGDLIIIKDKRPNARAAYDAMLKRVEEAKRHNEKLDEQWNKSWVDQKDYVDYKKEYNADYLYSMRSAMSSLAKALAPYSTAKTDMNTRDIHGNNKSSIINNSHLGNINKLIESLKTDGLGHYAGGGEALLAWGRKLLFDENGKLRNQYRYSNILLEHTRRQKQANGQIGDTIISKGIFRLTKSNDIEITDDALHILKFQLFEGAINNNNGENASYSEMTSSDYLPSMFNAFENYKSHGSTFDYGSFFLRTPSDAQKTFVMNSQKWKLGLAGYGVETSETTKEIVDSLIVKVPEHILTSANYRNKRFSRITNNNLEDILQGNNVLLNEPSSVFEIIDSSNAANGSVEAYVKFSDENNFNIVCKGTVRKVGKGYLLTNHEVVGYKASVNENDQEANEELLYRIKNILSDIYYKKLIKGDVTIGDKTYKQFELKVNLKRVEADLIKNKFKQEILNAITALNHYFVWKQTKDGKFVIATDKGKPVFKDGINPNEGYANYHLNKNGELLTKKGKRWALDGRAFHSSMFTLVTTNENGENVVTNYLDSLIGQVEDVNDDSVIDFFYGGGLLLNTENSYIDENGNLNVGTVEFSKAVNRKLNAQLTEFIKEGTMQAYYKLNAYEHLGIYMHLQPYSCCDFWLNYFLAYSAFDDLIEGNSKFYKSTQDLLKRAKEGQASGVPYGISNYDASFTPSLEDVEENSFMNTGTYKVKATEVVTDAKGRKVRQYKRDEKGQIVENTVTVQQLFNTSKVFKGTTQRKGFRGVTVANTVRTSTALEQLVHNLVDTGLTEDEARDLLYGPREKDKKGKYKKDKDGNYIRRGGFTETKVNDAQSYITVQEWARRVAARGQFQKYLPLIKKLIASEKNPNIKFTAAEMQQFIQVQKNIYYDIYHDDNYDLDVPRQIKNAEFVLVPQFIKGTQLEQVYNVMREADIDQLNTVETSKAAKEYVGKLWDNEGNLFGQEHIDDEATLKELVSNMATELDAHAQLFTYNNLYTQQETPQHADATNKAGLQIMKKLIDNIDENSPLHKLKEEYFDLFCSNIQESFSKLMEKYNIKLDANGNLDIENGFTDIDLQGFYNELEKQMLRTGIDSNMRKFITIDEETGQPLMNPYLNDNLTRFENIVQSVFNNRITRQKLKGFHAAQVTNVGWKSISSNFDNVGYCKELKYHPDGKGYIEIMVPASFFGVNKNSEYYKNKTDEEILKELEAAGLDTVIGYRIPTEGKQSICNMKVVGFVDDTFGSTIIVPDEWVAQTGSDFDIDSVYGIQAEHRVRRDGKVQKVKYKPANKRTTRDWIQYLNKKLTEEERPKHINEERRKAFAALNNKLQEEFKSLQDSESEVWSSLSDRLKTIFKNNDEISIKESKSNNHSPREKYIHQLIKRNGVIDKLLNSDKIALSEEEKTVLTQFKEINTKIIDYLDNQYNTYEEGKAEIEAITPANIETFNKLAKDAGLFTLDEYLNAENDLKVNNVKARSTRLFEIMKTILEDPSTLEENLSRYNFDDIIEARNEVMNPNVKIECDGRSAYNVFDQVSYQEEATSGLTLKGFSVALDTFCSVCNTAHPRLTKPVYVIYDTKDFDNPGAAVSRFGGTAPEKFGKTFSIKHDTYGWSRDNKNMVGKILTSYSSQTTAYILDAIKEGSLPNINTYTFSAWKTLANLGIDYRTSLSFMMQPAITRIVDAQKNNNSVYNEKYTENPIHKAISDIAKELGINVSDRTPITAIVASINSKYNDAFNKIFRQKGDEAIKISLNTEDAVNIPLITSKLRSRIFESDEFDSTSPVEEKLLFDLGVILAFNRLRETANSIGDISRCCNPDKFGAKQTVYSTRQIFDTIDRILYSRNEVGFDSEGNPVIEKARRENILEVDGKNLLEAIYPGIDADTFSVDDMIRNLATVETNERSVYPSLHAFLKYSTATSCIVSKAVFETQSTNFIKFVQGFKSVLSNQQFTLAEKTYKDVQGYILTSLYNQVPTIKYPLKFSFKKGQMSIAPAIDENPNVNDFVANQEHNRIYGYNNQGTNRFIDTYVDENGKVVRTSDTFTCEDCHNPTEEELAKFAKLSPAQKASWIASRFENTGVFGFLKINLFNDTKRGRWAFMQTIEYVESSVDNEVVRNEFRKAFNNTNPLIVSAAVDLLKYSIVVEGFNFTARALNKVLDYDALIKPLNEGGIGFMSSMNDMMIDVSLNRGLYMETSAKEDLYENYLRSHPDTKGIRKLFLSANNKTKYGINDSAFGMKVITRSNTGDETADTNAFNKLMEAAGIKRVSGKEHYFTNKYIRLEKNGRNVLYRINDFGDTIILYPLTKLNANENSVWSANELNNTKGLISKQGYKVILDAYVREKMLNDNLPIRNSEYVVNLYNANRNGINYAYVRRRADTKDAKPFEINTEAKAGNDKLKTVIKTIQDNYADYFENVKGYKPLYINTDAFDYYIPNVGHPSIQSVKIGDGYKNFRISKLNERSLGPRYTYISSFLSPDVNKAQVDRALGVIGNDSFTKVVTELRQAGVVKPSNLYKIDTTYESNPNWGNNNQLEDDALSEALY